LNLPVGNYNKIIIIIVMNEIFHVIKFLKNISIGTRLNYILKLYFDRLRTLIYFIVPGVTIKFPKSFNIIVIIDDILSDNFESVIIRAAKRFNILNAEL
jgi:hypothetical protein